MLYIPSSYAPIVSCASNIDYILICNTDLRKSLNDGVFSLKLISKVFVEPQALFSINLEYRASFEFSHKVDKKFIDKNVNELLRPIGSEMSYVTSTLTKAITDHYFGLLKYRRFFKTVAKLV